MIGQWAICSTDARTGTAYAVWFKRSPKRAAGSPAIVVSQSYRTAREGSGVATQWDRRLALPSLAAHEWTSTNLAEEPAKKEGLEKPRNFGAKNMPYRTLTTTQHADIRAKKHLIVGSCVALEIHRRISRVVNDLQI